MDAEPDRDLAVRGLRRDRLGRRLSGAQAQPDLVAGAFLDPVADKFLVCACVLVLVHLGRTDVFIALIIIGREIAISALHA